MTLCSCINVGYSEGSCELVTGYCDFQTHWGTTDGVRLCSQLCHNETAWCWRPRQRSVVS